ncbi:hypothetical protein MNBD_GAMMA24-1721 [hydrothermal vent metagenome]|uniref:Uncharacterized protein n=1 Tax=hydrothermal vent metagenome TaxID=652676 RepID=A0A3B1BT70_9ZZZZ
MNYLSAILIALMLFSVSDISLAERLHTGDWTVDYSGAFNEAYTENAAGKSIGFWCSTEENNCFFYLRTNTQCKENSRTLMEAKTEAGKTKVELLCHKVAHEGDYRHLYFFTDTAGTKTLLEERRYIEISLPGVGKETFSLKGSKISIRKVSALAGK